MPPHICRRFARVSSHIYFKDFLSCACVCVEPTSFCRILCEQIIIIIVIDVVVVVGIKMFIFQPIKAKLTLI